MWFCGKFLVFSIFYLADSVLADFFDGDDNEENINLRSRQQINAEALGFHFRGNSSQRDFFKLLERDGSSLLVGARDAVYNLSMETLALQQRLDWPSTSQDIAGCRMKGKNEEDCHNYIRVLVRQNGGRILVCGTNSFHPMCRQYINEDGTYLRQLSEFDGNALSPYDPRHNSTAVYLPEEDVLYSATVSDFTAQDPLIYRRPLSENGLEQLRTVRNDMKVLYDPSFVSSFYDEDHVYFWFRETAAEYENCGKAVYGRVARVCRKDFGRKQEWTSFLKTRLNCSLPGDIPVYFNELLATSAPVTELDGKQLVYGIMSTPENSLQMSAVCAFDVQDIRRIFDEGAFKVQDSARSQWFPDLPQGLRPGQCVDNSNTLKVEVTNYIRKNPLMDESVPNFFNQPLLVDSSFRSHFTQIAVHSGVQAVSGRRYDVLFLGTNDGKVLKMVNTEEARSAKSVLIESIRVFRLPQPVRNLMVYLADYDNRLTAQIGGRNRLVVVSDEEVRALPLHFCANHSTCGSCVSLQDPYCAWDLERRKCVGKSDGSWLDGGDYVQSIRTGRSLKCPEGDLDPALYAVNELYPSQVQEAKSPAIYSSESMAIAVVVTLAVASTIGFVVGYRLSRWKTANDAASSASGSDYGEYGRSRLTKHLDGGSATLKHLDAYGSSPPLTAKLNDTAPMSLVLTMPSADCCNNLKNEKNLLTLNNGTLPKDYKVKKVYL